jgi:hypothetical protein
MHLARDAVQEAEGGVLPIGHMVISSNRTSIAYGTSMIKSVLDLQIWYDIFMVAHVGNCLQWEMAKSRAMAGRWMIPAGAKDSDSMKGRSNSQTTCLALSHLQAFDRKGCGRVHSLTVGRQSLEEVVVEDQHSQWTARLMLRAYVLLQPRSLTMKSSFGVPAPRSRPAHRHPPDRSRRCLQE